MNKHTRRKTPALRHVVNILMACCILAIGVLDIKDDITDIRKEHGLVVISLIMLIKSTIEVRKTLAELRADMQA